MIVKTFCATCIGIEAVTVAVEADISPGIGIHLVGLPDVAVRESLLRVTTALLSYGFRIPGRRIVLNLAPADLRKEGSSYDLAIAISLLAASEQAFLPRCGEFILLGELALDGRIRRCRGVLPIASHAIECGFGGCIVPAEDAPQAADLKGLTLYGVSTLADVLDILGGQRDVSHLRVTAEGLSRSHKELSSGPPPIDFMEVKGQKAARRGMEIAAAGGHNLILIGPPGSGKSLMASCLPSILPPMGREESIETSKIYSVAGVDTGSIGLMTRRPFRAPHHSASLVALIGGGARISPGEISLAHNGVLYLDEMVQFGRSSLDALRQPVEDGHVTISRARYRCTFPSSFMLIASMNPCPCGYRGDGTGRCQCTPSQVEKYMGKVSGPMMDRIDMHIFVESVPATDLVKGGGRECSADIAARVLEARRIQQKRFEGTGIFTNAQMNATMIRKICKLGSSETDFLEAAIVRLNLSARAFSRILKLSRTIADLAASPEIGLQHLAEAFQYRSLDRKSLVDL